MFYQDLFILSTGTLILIVLVIAATIHYFVHSKSELAKRWIKISDLISIWHDTLPNLIYLAQTDMPESSQTHALKELIQKIIGNRSAAEKNLPNLVQLLSYEKSLQNEIHTLIDKMRTIPEINSNILFHEITKLIDQLEQKARRQTEKYNQKVQRYNNILTLFPFNIIALLGRFRKIADFPLN